MNTTGLTIERSDDLGDARNEGAKAVDHAKESASMLASAAKNAASDLAANAAETFKSAVHEQKSAGADAVGDLARAAKGAADNFQDRAPELANMVRNVADRVEGVSNDIRDRSLNDLITSVTEFASARPMAFLGCGVLAGVVLSRLLSGPKR